MKKILVVDDDCEINKMLKIFLLDIGYDPIIAKNSKEVMEDNYYMVVDLVITDYHMPWPDGLTLTKFIREKKPSIPVIIMSSDGDIENEVLSLSGVMFLEKPFKMTKLKSLIEALFKKGGGENEYSKNV